MDVVKVVRGPQEPGGGRPYFPSCHCAQLSDKKGQKGVRISLGSRLEGI